MKTLNMLPYFRSSPLAGPLTIGCVLLLSLALLAGTAGATSFNTENVYAPSGNPSSIAVDDAGGYHVATYNPFDGDLLYAYKPHLFGWEVDTVVVTTDNVGVYCALALDSNNVPHIAYRNGTTGQLMYASRTGGVWTTEIASSGPASGYHLSLVIDANDVPHIAFTDGDPGVMIYYLRKPGASWIQSPLTVGTDPEIAVDVYGRPHFVFTYVNAFGTNIRYGVISGATTSYATLETAAPGTGFSGSPSLALDVSGNPHVSYSSECKLRYGRRAADGTWALETVDVDGIVRASSIEIDPDGSPRIAYQVDVMGVCAGQEGMGKDLRYAEKIRGTWFTTLVETGGGINNGISPFLTLDWVGNPVISYGQELPQLRVATGRSLNARYCRPDMVRRGDAVQIDGIGSSMDGVGSAALVRPGTTLTPTGYAAVLDGDSIDLTFDLSAAPLGAYDLIVTSGADADTVENAVVIYDESADMARLTSNISPEITPMISNPGTAPRIVFASGREGNQELFVRPLSPGKTDLDSYRVTYSQFGYAQFPTWSPDGSRILYHDGAQDRLFITEMSTGYSQVPQFLSTLGMARNPSWHPTQNRFVYDEGSRLHVYNLDTSLGFQVPTFGPTSVIQYDGDWSPDGNALVFTQDDDLLDGRGIQTSVVFPDTLPGVTVVPEDGYDNLGPQWSPDGRWVAFTSNRATGLNDYDVWVADARGLGWLFPITPNLPGNQGQVTWGQDGTSLAFVTGDGEIQDVVQASNLPMFEDGDGDGVPDSADLCPFEPVPTGRFDRNGDGCSDEGSSFRFTRYWAPDRLPIVYEMTADADPSITDGSDFAAVDAGLATWTGPGAELAVVRVGNGLADAVSGDLRNSICFTDPDGYRAGTIAITFSTVAVEDTVIGGRLFKPGEVVDSDILFNTLNFDFFTPTSPGAPDAFSLQSVVVHEAGHFFGIGHSSISDETMFAVVYRDGRQETLEPGDVAIVSGVYHGPNTPPALSISGTVVRGEDLESPVPGAAVLALGTSDLADTLQMVVTNLDGTYAFYGLNEPVRVFVAPLDGGPIVNGLRARDVSGDLAPLADTEFLPEFYDGVSESNSDYGSFGVLISSFPTTDATIITNPDLTGPVVLAVTSPDSTTLAPASTVVVIQFDEEIDITSVPGNLSLINQFNGIPVAGTAAFITPSNLLIFTPTAPLDWSTPYQLDIGPGITDPSGNPMSDNVVWVFSTEAQPPVAIAGAAPGTVPVGGVLVLSGTGFSPTAGDNVVSFTGGASASAYLSTLEQVSVLVPPGAGSGDVTVSVGEETSNPFPIEIIPPQAPPIGVPLGSASLGGDPRKVTVTPSGASAYVATSTGVTAVAADPTATGFLASTDIPLGGGSRDAAAHPDGQRVLAVSSDPPRLTVIDSNPASSFFNTPVADAALPAEPLGIAVLPGGGAALVVYSGRVAAHSLASGTFGVEVREWRQASLTFQGDIVVSADGAEAYATTANGAVAVLGLTSGEGIVAVLPAGTTPRESAGSPLADSFFSVDDSGFIRRFAKRGPLEATLSVGGSYRGLAMSVEGSFALALNYTQNRVDVIDALAVPPVSVYDFTVGVDPVDLALGSAGRYIYVAAADEDVLEVYDSQSGVVLQSVSPRSGGFGAYITLAGSGFAPIAGDNLVTIGDVTLPVVSVNSDGTALLVQQSDNVVSGAVRVTVNGEISNTLSYKVVSRQRDPFVSLGVVNEFEIAQVRRYLESPDGRWLIGVRDDGTMVVIQADPARPDFLRPVQELTSTETTLGAGDPHMVMTPDGRTLYVGDNELNQVAVFDVGSGSTNPLTFRGHVRNAGGTADLTAQDLAMVPDGSRLLVTNSPDASVYEVSTENDSVLALNPGEAIRGFQAYALSIAVDPRGDRLYAGDNDAQSPVVLVFDLDPASPTYRQQVGFVSLTDVAPAGPYQLAVSPRGDFLYCVLSEPLALGTQFDVAVVDIRPTSPTYLQIVGTAVVGQATVPFVLPNRSGNVVYVLQREVGGQMVAYTADGSMEQLGNGPFSARLGNASDMVLSLDDARIYAASAGGGVYLTDVSGVYEYRVISGDNQTGVVNQPLPVPFVVRSTDIGGKLLEGTPVRLSAILGGNFGYATGDATVATGEDGLAEVSFFAGPNIGTEVADLRSGGGTLQFFVNVVGDTADVAPVLLTVTPGTADTPGIGTNVAIDFSKAINPATATPGAVFLRPSGAAAIAATISFANGQRRVVLDPAGPLAYGTQYDVVVGAGLQDYSGNPLSNPGTFTFTTGSPLPLRLDAIAASAARTGNVVVLSGTGFDPVAAQNTVLFSGGVAVTPSAGDQSSLRVAVPGGVATGDVQVVAGPDTSNALTFTLLGYVAPVNEVVDVVDVPASGQAIAVLPNGVRAYMTAPEAATVVPIRLADGMSESAIPVGSYPFAVAPAPNSALVYVSNFLSNTISVIGTDPSAAGFHRVVNTLPSGQNPAGLIVSPDGLTLYVCNYGESTLDFFDLDPNSATYNSARTSITTGSGSKAVTVSPDGATLIVGTSSVILLIDTSDGSAKASISTGSGSKSVTVTPDGALAVALLDNGDLLLVDITDGVPDDERARTSISTGSGSKSVTVSPDGGSVYVTQGDGTVQVYAIVTVGGSAAVAEPVATLYRLQLIATITVGENPEGLAFDLVTGTLLVVNSGDLTVTFINASGISTGPVVVLTNVDPNTINPGSKGKWISAALQFPRFLDPMDVVLSTVMIDSTVAADTTQSALTDKNGDGILEREVKFKRHEVAALYPDQDTVVVHITGIVDGREFAGQDTVRFLRPKLKSPAAGAIVAQGSDVEIRWEPMPTGPAHHMDIHWSRDFGETWESIVLGTEDDSSHVWTVPPVASSRDCLIMLVAKDARDGVDGIEIMTQPFTVSDAATGIEDRLPVRFALLPSAPNPFRAAGTTVRFELPEPGAVTVKVFAVDGSVVRTLAENEQFPAGRHAMVWDGRSERGTNVHGGVYFLKIVAGSNEAVQKIVRVTR